MPAIIEKKNCTGEFLDDGQYSRNGILRYERIFGDTFVSTGGVATTKVTFNTKAVVEKDLISCSEGCIVFVLDNQPFGQHNEHNFVNVI